MKRKDKHVNDSHKTVVKHLPEHGPIHENGKEILLSLDGVDITFGKGEQAVRAVKNGSSRNALTSL